MYDQRYQLYEGYSKMICYFNYNRYFLTKNVVTADVCSEKCGVFKVTLIVKYKIKEL